MHRKLARTDLYLSQEKRKQCKHNLKGITCICHWSWLQFSTNFSFSRHSAKGRARPFAVCAIHKTQQKDCFSHIIMAWYKWAQARPSINSLLCSVFYKAGQLYRNYLSAWFFSGSWKTQGRYLTPSESKLDCRTVVLHPWKEPRQHSLCVNQSPISPSL